MEILQNINFVNLLIVLGVIVTFNTWIYGQLKHIELKITEIDVQLYKTNETVTRLDENLAKFKEEIKSSSVKIAEKKKRKYVRKPKPEILEIAKEIPK